MPPPVYSAQDYLTQFQRLLPRGRVWHRSLGLVQDAALLTLMPTWARLQLRLNDLIGEIFPCTTQELLPEWEATLGLPDPCTGPLPSVPLRVAAVCTKFIARGGQSKDYYIALAAAAGFPITIKEFTPFLASRNRAGDPVYDEKWAYVWNVTTQSITLVTYFRASTSAAGDPLASWGNHILECLLDTYKPAHTTIIFSYIAYSIWDEGDTTWDGGASVWDQDTEVPPTTGAETYVSN